MLPHERTHAGPKEGRLRILRATRTQLEPIFLLYDADPLLERPAGEPAADVDGGRRAHRLWRVAAGEIEIDAPFLIADGHHRYETAVAYREEDPAATHTFAVLVSSRAPGLEIYPPTAWCSRSARSPASRSRAGRRRRRCIATGCTTGSRPTTSSDRARSRRTRLRTSSTRRRQEAIATVDRGEAAVAFLLAPRPVEQVAHFAAPARRCRRSRRSSLPKLTSGLLLFPVG